MPGITSTGFEDRTLIELKESIEADERALISPTIVTSTASMVGQMNGVMATKLRELWELGAAIYATAFTDLATGYPLTLRAALTGTTREEATATRVVAQCVLNAGTYAIGTLIASIASSPTSRFSNVEEVVSVGGSNDVIMDCETTGPVACNSGTLTVIASPLSGFVSVGNLADGNLGADEESDASLRLRRESELRAAGSTTADAIRADLLRDVDGVERVTVLENDTGTTDVNGVPGHSLECIVYGPATPTADDNQAVAEQIFASKAGGIGTYGGVTKAVTDAQNFDHSVRFTRPTSLRAYAWVTVTTDADLYAGDAAVKAAISAVADTFGPGDPLLWTRAIGAPYGVAGVLTVTAYGQNTTGTPSGSQTNVTPTVRQIVTLAAADVTVTVA